MDRFPRKVRPHSQSFNIIDSVCKDLSLVDSWRYFNCNSLEYTWSNASKSLKSRIDLFLISSSLLQHVQDISHYYAPFSDHLLIELSLQTVRKPSCLRGYWKLNNSILEDKIVWVVVVFYCHLVTSTSEISHQPILQTYKQ